VQGATLGSNFLPTDGRGRIYPYFTPSYDARYISAADLLNGSTTGAAEWRGGAFGIKRARIDGSGSDAARPDAGDRSLGAIAGIDAEREFCYAARRSSTRSR